MKDDFKEILFTEEAIVNRVKDLGARITEEYKEKAEDGIVLVGILKGAIFFMADFARAINLPLQIDFMTVSSYGNSVCSSGEIDIKQDLSTSIEGRHVIVVEDVLDSGLTLCSLVKELKTRNPLSVEVAVLFEKQIEREFPCEIRYKAFDCPNAFIVGYGLDYAQKYRNLPFVASLKKEVYE